MSTISMAAGIMVDVPTKLLAVADGYPVPGLPPHSDQSCRMDNWQPPLCGFWSALKRVLLPTLGKPTIPAT